MPKIQQWAKFPEALRRHLIERMSDRSITLTDLNRLRLLRRRTVLRGVTFE
jgi:UDP-N-acetylglucosamine 2-epimerase